MRSPQLLALLILSGCGTAVSDRTTVPGAPPTLVRMSDVDAEAVARPCGRAGYAQPLGFAPTDAELGELTADFPVLATQAPGFVPAASDVQVVGVVLNDGRRRLYLNALPPGSACAQSPTQPCEACEAGAWGALYDPETRTFEDLRFSNAG